MTAAVGVTPFEATDDGPLPTALDAVTVNEYTVPLINPVTVQVVAPAVEHIFAPGLEVTV